MSFAVLVPGSGAHIREYESLGHALRLASKVEGYVIDVDPSISFREVAGGRWDVTFGGEVTRRHWEVDYWTTDDLVESYRDIKPGEFNGVALTDGCPYCKADRLQLWPLMEARNADCCLYQCFECGVWSGLDWEPKLEPYVLSRPSGLSA